MKPLRILHTDFHRGWGGQAARVLMVSRELVGRGHAVTIAAPAGELTRRAREAARALPGLEVEDGFRFRPPARLLSFAADGRRLRALMRRGRFDVVDVHGSQDTWVAAAVRAVTGRPECLVMTRHNTKRVRTGPFNRLLYGRLVDHLIIVDESVRRQYESFLARGLLDPTRISVVPSAYRADLFHGGVDGGRVREELGLPGGAIVAGVAGRLVPDKGHVFLMRAAAALRPRLPGLVLVFAGAGPAERELKEGARALGLQESVRFLGFRSDIAEVQAAFDVAVLPSVGCDASSAAVKEAMALGRPVIASDIGGARGIIEDGLTGIVVPPGDAGALAAALARLVEHPDRARAMAREAGRRVSERYSVARLADQTLEAYAAALEGRAGLCGPATRDVGARGVGAGRTA